MGGFGARGGEGGHGGPNDPLEPIALFFAANPNSLDPGVPNAFDLGLYFLENPLKWLPGLGGPGGPGGVGGVGGNGGGITIYARRVHDENSLVLLNEGGAGGLRGSQGATGRIGDLGWIKGRGKSVLEGLGRSIPSLHYSALSDAVNGSSAVPQYGPQSFRGESGNIKIVKDENLPFPKPAE